jgi:hypothetical protein
MEKSRYVIGTDTYNDTVFSVCLFDRKEGLVVISESIFGEKEFEKRVQELSILYNSTAIKEYDKLVKTYNRTYAKIPHISELFKTPNSKKLMLDYVIKNDAIDYKLIQEFLNFK